MHNQLKIVIGSFLSLFILESYAIQVNVHSSSKEVAALGFILNGESYGRPGKSYSKTNLPDGAYTFGVRAGSIFSKNITCFTKKGQKSIFLKNDATAVLIYHGGGRCTLKIFSVAR